MREEHQGNPDPVRSPLRFLAAPTYVAFIDSNAIAGGRVLEWVDTSLPTPVRSNNLRTTKSLTWGPFSRSPSVRVRIDFDVHRSGDIGSPRVAGSISDSNAATSSSSWDSARFRTPPERRDRPAAGAVPSSASFRPGIAVVISIAVG